MLSHLNKILPTTLCRRLLIFFLLADGQPALAGDSGTAVDLTISGGSLTPLEGPADSMIGGGGEVALVWRSANNFSAGLMLESLNFATHATDDLDVQNYAGTDVGLKAGYQVGSVTISAIGRLGDMRSYYDNTESKVAMAERSATSASAFGFDADIAVFKRHDWSLNVVAAAEHWNFWPDNEYDETRLGRSALRRSIGLKLHLTPNFSDPTPIQHYDFLCFGCGQGLFNGLLDAGALLGRVISTGLVH